MRTGGRFQSAAILEAMGRMIRAGLIFAFFFAFVCSAVFVQPVSAQQLLERFNIPLPEIPFLEEAAFQEATILHQEMPQGDPILAYEIRMPKDWTKESGSDQGDFTYSAHILGEIARYYGPPVLGERSYFTIQVSQMQHEISAAQWFLQYVLSNGYTLEGFKIHDKKKVEALYVLVDRNVSYSVRAVAQINEKRMILAQYFVPYENWEQQKSMQAQSINSFRLLNLKPVLIEDMNAFQFLDISEFRYPKSWELHSQPLRSIDRMGADLLNLRSNQALDGQISVNLISHFITESLKGEIKAFKTEMENRGMVFGDLIEKRDDFDLDVLIDFSLTEVYRVTDKENSLQEYEFWFTVMSSGAYYYFVSLLTPSRDADFFTWGRNTETYRLVLEYLTPQKESLTSEQ